MALLIAGGGLAMLSQACGGGSASVAATPTARPLPSRVAANGTPQPGSNGTPQFRNNFSGTPPADFTPGAFGTPGAGRSIGIGGFDNSALAAFLGISQDQLQSELQAEGATLATVAQAHGKSRDDLKNFLTDQIRQNTQQALTDGRMTQEQADSTLQALPDRVDQMIDGNMQFRGPPSGTPQPGQ
jgi:hypothetical protein